MVLYRKLSNACALLLINIISLLLVIIKNSSHKILCLIRFNNKTFYKLLHINDNKILNIINYLPYIIIPPKIY